MANLDDLFPEETAVDPMPPWPPHVVIKYDKLVRDDIPDVIAATGVTPKWRTCADDTEYEARLFQKLHEEIAEFEESKSIDELADLQEVLDAIKTLKGWGHYRVTQTMEAKSRFKGKFQHRIILEEA